MTYVADPAGLGVGKTYGPQKLGGNAGVTGGANDDIQLVAQIRGDNLSENARIDIQIPDGYALITGVQAAITEAFTALDVIDVFYGGSTVMDGNIAADTVGVVEGDLTIIGHTVVEPGTSITVDVSGLTAGAGDARVSVDLKRV